MHTVELTEAKRRLQQLIEEATEGEEIIIRDPRGRTVRLVPTNAVKSRPRFGSARDLIEIGENFDASIEDFKDYMP